MEHLVTNEGPLQSPASAWPRLTPKHPVQLFSAISHARYYSTIILRARVGYEMVLIDDEASNAELAIIIPYPTSASGILFFLTLKLAIVRFRTLRGHALSTTCDVINLGVNK